MDITTKKYEILRKFYEQTRGLEFEKNIFFALKICQYSTITCF